MRDAYARVDLFKNGAFDRAAHDDQNHGGEIPSDTPETATMRVTIEKRMFFPKSSMKMFGFDSLA